LGAQTAGAGTTLALCRDLIMAYTAGWVIFIYFSAKKPRLWRGFLFEFERIL
jgi:hypothetical protein